jgi:hypothetical protein
MSWDQLTYAQLLFKWSLAPLQPSKFSFEYLLPPISALETVPLGITPKDSSLASTPDYSPGHRFYLGSGVWVERLSMHPCRCIMARF